MCPAAAYASKRYHVCPRAWLPAVGINCALSSSAEAQTCINGVINLAFKMNDFSTSNLHRVAAQTLPCSSLTRTLLYAQIVALPSYPSWTWLRGALWDIMRECTSLCGHMCLCQLSRLCTKWLIIKDNSGILITTQLILINMAMYTAGVDWQYNWSK